MPRNMAPKHFEQMSAVRLERQKAHLALSGDDAAPQFGQFKVADFKFAAPTVRSDGEPCSFIARAAIGETSGMLTAIIVDIPRLPARELNEIVLHAALMEYSRDGYGLPDFLPHLTAWRPSEGNP